MIICYDEVGRIGLTINDPMPKGTIAHYTALNKQFIVYDDPASDEFYLTHYVEPVTRILTERPSFAAPAESTIAADDVDTFGLADLPQPCTVTVDGVAYEVTDGTFEFTTSMPGSYAIGINQWPYMPFVLEVNAQ